MTGSLESFIIWLLMLLVQWEAHTNQWAETKRHQSSSSPYHLSLTPLSDSSCITVTISIRWPQFCGSNKTVPYSLSFQSWEGNHFLMVQVSEHLNFQCLIKHAHTLYGTHSLRSL